MQTRRQRKIRAMEVYTEAKYQPRSVLPRDSCKAFVVTPPQRSLFYFQADLEKVVTCNLPLYTAPLPGLDNNVGTIVRDVFLFLAGVGPQKLTLMARDISDRCGATETHTDGQGHFRPVLSRYQITCHIVYHDLTSEKLENLERGLRSGMCRLDIPLAICAGFSDPFGEYRKTSLEIVPKFKL
ncbi:hypothetical protein J6590_004572 [Homalodisca vitripennis]|nr:hypothetical protein J6590_004572 [Homalodisca vitripennis]